jgi:polyisoprenoid-binding protein YceI
VYKAISLLFVFVYIGTQAQTSYKVQSGKVTFAIQNAGLEVDGSFRGLNAEIYFSPQALATSTIKASVAANTISTGIDARDRHLKKETYFDVDNFPDIVIQSSFFGKTPTGFKAYCKLTMKGITKDIVIPFTFNEQTNTMNGSFALNRLEYKIGTSSLILSNNVVVYINLILETHK